MIDEGATGLSEETGNTDVDEVLQSLETLDELPLEQHVAVFERAHERLRALLDGSIDGPRDA